ncbi:MAG: A24 family peptidase [Candidatus Velamenicoccus archaeovorus]
MSWVRVVVALPFGLVFGSFLTVVVTRVPAGESIVRPRSRCPGCGTQIRSSDNIPVLSWIVLRGRCRACGARIPVTYPLLELGTAALFVAAALRFDDVWVAVMMAPFCGLMLGLAVIDYRHKILPNRIVYPSLILFPAYLVVAAVAGADVDLARAGIGLLAYGGGLLVVAIVSPRGMGMGDVKLAALIGVVLGSLGLRSVGVAAAAGILLGGVVAVGALLAGAGRKRAIPFGPFLAAGAVIAAFWGPELASLYLNRLP